MFNLKIDYFKSKSGDNTKLYAVAKWWGCISKLVWNSQANTTSAALFGYYWKKVFLNNSQTLNNSFHYVPRQSTKFLRTLLYLPLEHDLQGHLLAFSLLCSNPGQRSVGVI